MRSCTPARQAARTGSPTAAWGTLATSAPAMTATTYSTTSTRACTGRSCQPSSWQPCSSMTRNRVAALRSWLLCASASHTAPPPHRKSPEVRLAAGLVFGGLNVFDIGLAVFCGRLGHLAEHLLPCGPVMAQMTHAAKVAMLRERLRPIVSAGCIYQDKPASSPDPVLTS